MYTHEAQNFNQSAEIAQVRASLVPISVGVPVAFDSLCGELHTRLIPTSELSEEFKNGKESNEEEGRQEEGRQEEEVISLVAKPTSDATARR